MKRFVFAFALLLTTSAAFADGPGLPPLPPHAAAAPSSSGTSALVSGLTWMTSHL